MTESDQNANKIVLRGTKRPHEEDADDQLPPDPDPNKNFNGPGTKHFKPETNHWFRVIDVFMVEKKRMVLLEIKFKPRPPKHPDRDKEVYRIMISFKSIEKKTAHEEIREKLQMKTNIMPFFSNDQKYSRQLYGAVQRYQEYDRNTPESSEKKVLVFDRPSPFELGDKVYFACGDVWQLTSPVKKLDEEELLALPCIIEYNGAKVEYELNEEKVITTIVDLIKKYTEMQPNPENHGFFIAYFSQAANCQLYTVNVWRYNFPVTYCFSGKLVGCGKSLACLLCQLMLTGIETRGGEFSGPEVSKMVNAGEQAYIDELHLTRRDSVASLTNIITGQYQCLKRMVAKGGGNPKATVQFHCNKHPSELKLDPEVLTRLLCIYAGETPMRPIPGYRKMMEAALDIHKYLPNLLNIAVECFYELVPDEQLADLMDTLGNDRNKAQQHWNLKMFHNKLQSLADKYGLEDLPECLKREVDSTPYIVQNKIDDISDKSIGQFLSALDENDCWLSSWKGIDGIKIWVSGLRNCPTWVNDYACKNLECSTQGGKRFRFVEHGDLEHELLRKLKLKSDAEKKKKKKAAKTKKKAAKKAQQDWDTSSSSSSEESDSGSEDCCIQEKEFNIDEDLNILKAVAQPGMADELKNDCFWQEMETKGIVPGRRWKEIRTRFFDYIVPNLNDFEGLSPKCIRGIHAAAGIPINANLEKMHSFNLDNGNGVEDLDNVSSDENFSNNDSLHEENDDLDNISSVEILSKTDSVHEESDEDISKNNSFQYKDLAKDDSVGHGVKDDSDSVISPVDLSKNDGGGYKESEFLALTLEDAIVGEQPKSNEENLNRITEVSQSGIGEQPEVVIQEAHQNVMEDEDAGNKGGGEGEESKRGNEEEENARKIVARKSETLETKVVARKGKTLGNKMLARERKTNGAMRKRKTLDDSGEEEGNAGNKGVGEGAENAGNKRDDEGIDVDKDEENSANKDGDKEEGNAGNKGGGEEGGNIGNTDVDDVEEDNAGNKGGDLMLLKIKKKGNSKQDVGKIDMGKEVQENTVGKLTVNVLKAWLKLNGVSTSKMKKVDLVEAVKEVISKDN